jgi:hypothetical protein
MPIDTRTRENILRQLDRERRELAPPRRSIEILPHVTRRSSVDGSHHWIYGSEVDESSADQAIEAEIEHFRRLDKEFEWTLCSHDRPPDLLDRLRARGFEIEPVEAIMVYDLATPAEWVNHDSAKVIRIDREEQLRESRRVAEEVFGKDYSFTFAELADELRARSTHHRGYIAYIDDEPASIGRLYTQTESWFGGLYGGATRAAFRGRGLYRAVVAARARDAIESGAKYLTVDALPTSRPILERLGFERIADTWPCIWKP